MSVFITRIKGISIHCVPGHNFRTTKGGKRILTSDPMFQLNLTIHIDEIVGLSNSDVVFVGKTPCVYFKNEKGSSLINYSLNTYNNLTLDTEKELEVCLAYRMVGEGTNQYNHK